MASHAIMPRLDAASRPPSDQLAAEISVIVPAMHCGGCLSKVERALNAMPGVLSARANLSTKRVRVAGAGLTAGDVHDCLDGIGFDAVPSGDEAASNDIDKEAKSLLIALAVAGFAMMNIMLLSVSIWAGLVSDMGEVTRTLFHWLSAMIAVPAVLFSGRPFFRSAVQALSRGTTNMDVPISLAVLLSTGASLLVTLRGGEHAYFDAAVMLLFFLLCGRYLDKTLRARTFSAAQALLKLKADHAQRIMPDGNVVEVDIRAVTPGMKLRIMPGERLPVDCTVEDGQSDLDMSMVTGESEPITVAPGADLYAGTLNVTGALTVKASGDAEHSFLADMVRIMENAEQSRAPLVTLADRVARAYAPVVHVLAAATFAAWMFMEAGWYPSLMIAVAVLIITCPCALGLAVPAVQVTAVGKLLQDGIVLRAGDALDRLAQIDTVVFDKTGTLTNGKMTLKNQDAIDPAILKLAASLALSSAHPLAKALSLYGDEMTARRYSECVERPGCGIEAIDVQSGARVRLGRRDWAAPHMKDAGHAFSELVFSTGPDTAQSFHFTDTLRQGAKDLVSYLKDQGLQVVLLSGDKEAPVSAVAGVLGIHDAISSCRPDEKVDRLNALSAAGRRVLMVGDGLNDAPALRAALVSMSPSSATDIAQVSADIVYQGEDLEPLKRALTMARRADAKVKQNFALALGYNAIAVPLAVCGIVTPLIAAIAMSASSLLVTGNAALLRRTQR